MSAAGLPDHTPRRAAIIQLLIGAAIIGTNGLMVRFADTPPTVSAIRPNRLPRKRPARIPAELISIVVRPMAKAITKIFTCRKASETPTAIASSEVPMAVTTVAQSVADGASPSSARCACRIMWTPTAASSAKAVQ